MPLDFDILDSSRPPWERGLYYSIDGMRYNPITNKVTFSNEERTEKKMEVRDKICDKCRKRYSVAEMRVYNNGEYTDKECYLDNNVPIDAYPKMYHSRTDEQYVGRGMDLCPECANELKQFAGEE